MMFSAPEKYRVAVISFLNDPVPMPSSALDRLYAWSDVESVDAAFFDASQSGFFKRLSYFDPGIIVLDASFLRRRWSSEEIRDSIQTLKAIASLDRLVIAAPLDEAYFPDVLEIYYKVAKVRRVLTCAEEIERRVIYSSTFNSIQFIGVRAALLRASTKRKLKRNKKWSSRKYDVMYRGYYLSDEYDKKAREKQILAELVAKISMEANIKSSISLNSKEIYIKRRSWYSALNNSRAVVGAESGMGSIICYNKSDERHYKKVKYRSISGRHIEAALANCTQLLVEGEFSGILRPGRDYISVSKPFMADDVSQKIHFCISSSSEKIRASAKAAILSAKILSVDHYVGAALDGLRRERPSSTMLLKHFIVRWAFRLRLLEIRAARVSQRLKGLVLGVLT